MDHLPRGISTADLPHGHVFPDLFTVHVKMEPSGSYRLLSGEVPCIGVVWGDKVSFAFKFTIPPVT